MTSFNFKKSSKTTGKANVFFSRNTLAFCMVTLCFFSILGLSACGDDFGDSLQYIDSTTVVQDTVVAEPAEETPAPAPTTTEPTPTAPTPTPTVPAPAPTTPAPPTPVPAPTSPAPTAPRSNIIFESLFEKDQDGFNASEGGDWNGVEAATKNSILRSSERSRSGRYSAKFTLNKSDADQGGSKRAELTDWSGRMPSPKAERWYGLSMFLPGSYAKDPCEEIVFQWHGVNSVDLDGESMSNPALAMLTRNGKWVLNAWDGPIDLGAYDQNVWTDWVLHIKFSPDPDGLIEIWKNGEKVLTLKGKNTYRDKVGNYFKMGIYKYGWKDGYVSTTSSRTIYYDEVRVGNEKASFSDVAPN